MDLQETVDEVARVLGASATLEDRAFQLLAYAAQSGDIDSVRSESILRRRATDEVRAYFEGYGIATAPGPVRIPADTALGVLARVCVPLRRAGVTYGYLWLLEPDDGVGDAMLARIAPLAEVAAGALALEARGRQDLGRDLRDLLSADPELRAGALTRLDLDGPVAAVAVRGVRDRPAPLWTLPRGVLAQAGDPVAVVAPAGTAAEVAARAQAMYGTAAGVGAPRSDPADAWRSWREARQALRVAERIARFRPVARWPDLGVYRMLARLPAAELAMLAAEAADLLSDCELAHTVETYLDHGGHAQETAVALGMHRQTLYYRLSKAERTLAVDLADGETRLRLHLALKAARLAG
ncbi:helix-turn-helix domain-containing protein [Spongiactinospora sp. TRM90649]|uniref:PucR family transcriptional regulator n=1 Tax=Spongiactinospora sp. TRM90649 TaxID=3031114 RepID=UPI0023F79C26|nr:helix-turn-helix domain-containing protein [Spongiactinospora sp. TRM90649]MDF5755871.1 helix-turn-helix domain-containing protein [Spongiactinospora sp. TRM90649]